MCYMHFLCIFAIKKLINHSSIVRQKKKTSHSLTHTEESLAKSHFSRVLIYIYIQNIHISYLKTLYVARSSDFFGGVGGWLTLTIGYLGMEASRPRQRPLVLVGNLSAHVTLKVFIEEIPYFFGQIVGRSRLLSKRAV